MTLLSALFFFVLQNAPLPSAPPPSPAAVTKSAEAAQLAKGPIYPPIVIYQVDPEFTEEARKKGVRGDIELSLTVDERGVPQNVVLVHGLGLGLDEKAIEAVKQYRYKPATQNGKPVAMQIHTTVNFQIF